jgi:hypothetical protein
VVLVRAETDTQRVTNLDVFRRLHAGAVQLDLAAIDRLGRL